MSDEFVSSIIKYVNDVICGFESGMFKMVKHKFDDRVKLLCSNYQPFITIFRDLHEKYYTDTYNSIVKRDDPNINKIFDNFQKL